MPRRGAAVSQADVARALRAARQVGAHAAEVRPDGTVVILLQGPPVIPSDDPFAAWERDYESAKATGRR
jgi:hypothetical protein